jgi:hypothetical protein
VTASSLLERMRANRAGEWQIGDVEALCREHGLSFRRVVERHTRMENIPWPARY